MTAEPLATGRSAVPTRDWLKLGRTSGQRSAEIVAGIRAITFPSPEALGLSSPTGRWFANLLKNLNNDIGITNATGVRHLSLTHLANQLLTERNEPPKVIVEMAAGFSARAFNLAKRYPQARVIEVDQPGVIAAKRDRLSHMWGNAMPPNLYWMSANLAEKKLSEVVGERAIDMVISEGVLPYFTPEEITRIAASVRASLVPNGIFVTDVVSADGWKVVESKSGLAAWLLRRQVGQFKGAMSNTEQIRKVFKDAGYSFTAVAELHAMAEEYNLTHEVADVSFIVAAHNLEAGE
jgi:O-methyltransferase involved in polyketide biosynthesis